MSAPLDVGGFVLQDAPRIYVVAIPGKWLLRHTTPSWRVEDPDEGFQRIVRTDRARQIAETVLEEGRTFPNAIVLATDKPELASSTGGFKLQQSIRFLVVDGQHRLWAQKFSDREGLYACVVHMGLSEVEMARLFLEINDNQKRVPASLRWDLVRLVRPDGDQGAMAAVDLVYMLATEEGSPLYQRIDLTGEQQEIVLKQASLAPELRLLFRSSDSPLRNRSVEEAFAFMSNLFTALRVLDPAGWKRSESVFYKARVVRALLKLVPDIVSQIGKDVTEISARDLRSVLEKIQPESLETESIKAVQGSAGIAEIAEIIGRQIRR